MRRYITPSLHKPR